MARRKYHAPAMPVISNNKKEIQNLENLLISYDPSNGDKIGEVTISTPEQIRKKVALPTVSEILEVISKIWPPT